MIKLDKTKKVRTDHFSVAVAFINQLFENNVDFTISELTPMLFRFMVDNGHGGSQPNVSKTLFYVKNYITLKVAKTIAVVSKNKDVSDD